MFFAEQIYNIVYTFCNLRLIYLKDFGAFDWVVGRGGKFLDASIICNTIVFDDVII
jgi:hypothetical protein